MTDRPSARVRAPATSANLGPGFDAYGLALDWHDVVEATATATGIEIDVIGEGAADVPRDESHLVARAARAAFDVAGVAQPGLALRCHNAIPHGRGLGSSAAAIVTGIRIAEALGGQPLAGTAALRLATELEGHPDNVAACLLGGFTIAWTEADGARAVRLDPDPALAPVVFVPPGALSTEVARGLLPETVSHRDASVNAARAGLLVAAITGHSSELLAATEDRLHQRHRAPAMPESLALVDRLRAAGIAAVVSGAGPTVLAFGTATAPVDAGAWTPDGWRARAVSTAAGGAAADAG